jgi:hypothetical protein
MPTTTNYGWTTPADTDLVKDGAAAIRTLGSSIDTTLKTQIDAQIPDSLLTTTGDVIYASGASTPARLGIGTTGQVLSVSGGVPAWSNPASGFYPNLTPQNSGQWINGRSMGTTVTGVTVIEDTTYYRPFFLSGLSFDRISFATAGGFSGTASVRLGIYNASQTTGKPTTVFLDAGTVNATAANTEYAITISSTPPAGFYYLAFNMQTSPTGNEFQGFNIENNPMYVQTGSTATGSSSSRGYRQSSVTGAFATATSLTINSTDNLVVGLRIV